MDKTDTFKLIKICMGSAAAMFLAMGVGRFAFTPILPLMQGEFSFSDTVAGLFASINYAGYLLGAVVSRFINPSTRIYHYRTHLVLTVILTGLMGIGSSFSAWYVWRFIAGVSSAVILIVGSNIAIDHLKALNKVSFSGVTFAGIGGGIFFTGVAVNFAAGQTNSSGIWILLALLSLVPAFMAYLWLPEIISAKNNTVISETKKTDYKRLYMLYISYFCEGLGYIITATFLVTYMKRMTGSFYLANNTWVIVGFAAATFTMLWPVIASRFGFVFALSAAHFVQAGAIIVPLFMPDVFGAVISALGFGGTFLGIVSLSLVFGQQLKPDKPHHAVATLTILFSLGQIIGPVAAGYLSDRTGSFSTSLTGAAIIVFLGIIPLIIKRKSSL